MVGVSFVADLLVGVLVVWLFSIFKGFLGKVMSHQDGLSFPGVMEGVGSLWLIMEATSAVAALVGMSFAG